MTFKHQTAAEIMATRHVRTPDDMDEVTSSRECYMQILSMIIVADQETKDNNGNHNDSIKHLKSESTRMETRLIELCGETFVDIKNGSEDSMNELFDNADYPLPKEDEPMGIEDSESSELLDDGQDEEPRFSYLDVAQTNKNMIRMRMSFRGQQKHIGIEAKAKESKRICKALIHGSRNFDDNIKLTTWNNVGPEVGLQDLDILSDETVNKFLDLPRSGPLKGDVHSIGIRIVTELTPEEFSRNWNKYRWKSSNNNLLRIREAETQSHMKAYAIGHIQGTSPNGDYTTIKKEIKDTTNNKAEASWQMFNIPNVSAKMWNVARNEAMQLVGDDRSPEFKRKKFALSPEGLTVYVKDYKNIKHVKKHLIDKYGRRTSFKDGSVSRFIPYVHGRVKDRKIIDDKLFTIIKTHCTTKAAEVSIPLDIQDIHETKDYLNGKSVEQLIHEITDSDGERIFNHIGHRWSTEYNSKSYIITASESKMNIARTAVEDLKNSLHQISKPPEKIFSHFADAQKGWTDKDASKRKRQEEVQDDEDAQTYYERDDDCGNEERKNLPSYVMHIVLDNKENDDASSMGFSNATKSISSRRKGILKRNNHANSDEEDSLESTTTAFTNKTGFTARTVSFDVPKECGRIEAALKEKGISSEIFRSWKEENSIEFNVILKIHSTTAHRVKGIRKVLKNWTGTAAAEGPRKST